MAKLNLNTASIADLMTIPGVDAATAFYVYRLRQIRRISSWKELADKLRLPASILRLLQEQAVLADQ